MKRGWITKTLGELSEYITDGTHNSPPYTKTGIPMLDSKHVKEGFVIDDTAPEKFISLATDTLLAKRCKPSAGDILISSRGSIGKIAIVRKGQNFNIMGNMILIKLLPTISREFVAYYLHGQVIHIESIARGVAQKGLYLNQIRDYDLPLPPLPEQQRIVGILDEAFDGIATAKAYAEKNLQNARALFASHLQSVFTQRGDGWVEKSLGDVCDLLNGFAFKSGDVVSESQTQLVRMGNLYGNRLDLDRSPVFYPDKFAVDYSRYLLKEGDLIISLTGTKGKEDYGYVVAIPECTPALLMNQRIAKFYSIMENLVNKGYLMYYLRSRVFLDILYPTANGTRQGNLSSVTIKTLPIPLCKIRDGTIKSDSDISGYAPLY